MKLPQIVLDSFPKIEYKKKRISLSNSIAAKDKPKTKIILHKHLDKLYSKHFTQSYFS